MRIRKIKHAQTNIPDTRHSLPRIATAHQLQTTSRSRRVSKYGYFARNLPWYAPLFLCQYTSNEMPLLLCINFSIGILNAVLCDLFMKIMHENMTKYNVWKCSHLALKRIHLEIESNNLQNKCGNNSMMPEIEWESKQPKRTRTKH